MPPWLRRLWVLAFVGAALCLVPTSGVMAITGQMFWILCANLWVLAALATPMALGSKRLALTGCVALGLVAGSWALVQASRFHLVSEVMRSVSTQAGGLPVSVEFSGSLDVAFQSGCDALCRRLLIGGDVTWVRMPGVGPSVVYARADGAECLARNPIFDLATPCVLPRRDSGMRADIRVFKSHAPPPTPSTRWGPVSLMRVTTWSVQDQRLARALVIETQVGWLQTWPLPILPASEFSPFATQGWTESPDLASLLARAGLRLAPP